MLHRRHQLLAELAARTLHYAAPCVPAQTSDLLLRALAKGTAAAAVELENSVEACAAAVKAAVQQLPGMADAASVPSVAWGVLQRLLLAPPEPGAADTAVRVRPRVACRSDCMVACLVASWGLLKGGKPS